MTVAKIDLGRRLFYDTRLSGNGTFACATCHQQARAFTDGRARAIGSTGAAHARSAMSLTNVAYNASFGWADPSLANARSADGGADVQRAPDRARPQGPRAGGRPPVRRRRRGFRRGISRRGRASHARRTSSKRSPRSSARCVSGDSPLDRYLYRDDKIAMSAAALRGMATFFSKRLALCRVSWLVQSVRDRSISTGRRRPMGKSRSSSITPGSTTSTDAAAIPASDRGLVDITHGPQDMGRFRAPTLRNIAVTAPYMHDGSVPTLEAAVVHYASGGRPSPFRSDRVRGFLIRRSACGSGGVPREPDRPVVPDESVIRRAGRAARARPKRLPNVLTSMAFPVRVCDPRDAARPLDPYYQFLTSSPPALPPERAGDVAGSRLRWRLTSRFSSSSRSSWAGRRRRRLSSRNRRSRCRWCGGRSPAEGGHGVWRGGRHNARAAGEARRTRRDHRARRCAAAARSVDDRRPADAATRHPGYYPSLLGFRRPSAFSPK